MLAIHGDLASFPNDDTPQTQKAYSKASAQPTGPKCRTLQPKGQWTMGGVPFFGRPDNFARVTVVIYYQKPGIHMYFLWPGEKPYVFQALPCSHTFSHDPACAPLCSLHRDGSGATASADRGMDLWQRRLPCGGTSQLQMVGRQFRHALRYPPARSAAHFRAARSAHSRTAPGSRHEQAFLNELIAKGILYEVMIYPMRKHGIADPPATIHLFRTMREFWRRNL